MIVSINKISMYIPKHYEIKDKEDIIAFMQKYSFASIITSKNNIPIATHLPFIVREKDNQIVLTSHFAKANPQWKDILDNKVLIVFSEPHAYISPKYYTSNINVPTWNYIAVHVYGKGTIITDEDQSFSLLENMINNYEAAYKPQWDALSKDYKLKMLHGIIPFEITVTDIQAKKKLSQNKTEVERQNIISAFEKSNDQNEQMIAEYMRDSSKLSLSNK